MRIAALALVACLLAAGAIAGDEVDYSAPYVTLENGELVTRYPTKEHTELPGEMQDSQAQRNASPSAVSSAVIAVSVLAALAILVAGLRLRRDRTR